MPPTEKPKIVWEGKEPELNIPKHRPKVILSCAVSLDGKLASKTGDSSFSSFGDKVEVHKLRTNVHAVLVGIRTLLRDDPHLTVSQKYYKSDEHPARVVLDSKARTPPNSKFVQKRPKALSLVATTERAPKRRVNALREAGAEVRILGEETVSIPRLLEVLVSDYEIEKLMVEGGGEVIGSFFRHQVVDSVRLSFTPVFLGNTGAVNMVRGFSFATVDDAPKFQLTRIELIGWNIILHLVRPPRKLG